MGNLVKGGILVGAGLALAAGLGYWLGTQQPQVDGRRIQLKEDRTWQFAQPLERPQTENGITYRLLDVCSVPLLIGNDRYEPYVQVSFLVTPSPQPIQGQVRAVLKDAQGHELVTSRAMAIGGSFSGFPLPEDAPDDSELLQIFFSPPAYPDDFTVEIEDTSAGQPAHFRFDHLRPLYRDGGSVSPVLVR